MIFFKKIAWLVLLALLVAFASYRVLHSYWHSERDFLLPQSNLHIEHGATLSDIVLRLEQRQIIAEPMLSKLCLRLFNSKLVIKAGEYVLPQHSSYAGLYTLLASGVSVQYRVTFVEGQTAVEAYTAVANKISSIATGEKHTLRDATTQQQWLKGLLSKEAQAFLTGSAVPEGWFFPDTYYFGANDTLRSVMLRAHKKMLAVLASEWAQRQPDLPYQNRYEALIMASLIEKETGVGYERAEIAGVFVRRLNLRMRLQTDPSVIYGMGDNYKGNITRADLKRDQAYNTYTRFGLPPTPIALPGQAAIHAALHPADGDALYFVAKGDGSHQFSATLKEHLAAVRQYQILNRRTEYRSAPSQ